MTRIEAQLHNVDTVPGGVRLGAIIFQLIHYVLNAGKKISYLWLLLLIISLLTKEIRVCSGIRITGLLYVLHVTQEKLFYKTVVLVIKLKQIAMEMIEMNIRTKTCPICGKHFSYPIGKGTDRKHCSTDCREAHKKQLAKERLNTYPECKSEGCSNPANRVSTGLCETCYYRFRRTGSTDKPKPKYRYKTGAGYIKIKIPDHPLADSHGNVFEHRKVMYEVYGPGDQSCYWCDDTVDWTTLVVDHLDENKQNNKPSNLVISCNNCNRARGAMLPFIDRLRPEVLDTFIDRVREYYDNRKTVQEDGGFGNG
jgi:hypothetical protein